MTPRGESNNNPGNLRWVAGIHWLGLADPPRDDKGFCRFVSAGFGIRALARDLLTSWRDGRRSVEAIVAAYAPPSENDAAAYIAAVSKALSVAPSAALDLADHDTLRALVRAVIRQEEGRVIYDDNTIGQAISMALAP
jgi:hypothetical protein